MPCINCLTEQIRKDAEAVPPEALMYELCLFHRDSCVLAYGGWLHLVHVKKGLARLSSEVSAFKEYRSFILRLLVQGKPVVEIKRQVAEAKKKSPAAVEPTPKSVYDRRVEFVAALQEFDPRQVEIADELLERHLQLADEYKEALLKSVPIKDQLELVREIQGAKGTEGAVNPPRKRKSKKSSSGLRK